MGRADEKITAIRAVTAILSNDGTVKSLGVGQKIFPIVAPEGTDGDFLTYRRDGYERADSKMGAAVQRSVICIEAGSADYDRSLALAEAVCAALEGEHPNEGLRVAMKDYSEKYADKRFIQVLKFSIQ